MWIAELQTRHYPAGHPPQYGRRTLLSLAGAPPAPSAAAFVLAGGSFDLRPL